MNEPMVAAEISHVNPAPHPSPVIYRSPRTAVRLYQKLYRAILYCHGCGNACRGFKVHQWKFCPFCGAGVQSGK